MSGKKLSPRQLGSGRLPAKSPMGKQARKKRVRDATIEDELPPMPQKR